MCPFFEGSASKGLKRYNKIHWGCSFGCKNLLNFICLTMKFHKPLLSYYFNLPNNRAANLILFWKKSILHVLIRTFFTHFYYSLPNKRAGNLKKCPSCTFIPSCMIIGQVKVSITKVRSWCKSRKKWSKHTASALCVDLRSRPAVGRPRIILWPYEFKQ